MARRSASLLLWIPRILGIVVSLFIGMFALDAFSAGKPLVETLADFAIHLTPALLLLSLVLASFRWEWVGGVAFIALAIMYALTMSRGRLDWMLLISGPLMVVGVLFMWSWFHHNELRAS